MATQTSDPLVRAGTPKKNVGRPSSGQKYTSLLGHGLWQRTNRAVSAGISTVCNNRARLTRGGWSLGSVKVYGLWIWLRRGGSAKGDINMDPQRPHNVHSYQHWGQLKTDDDYEACPSSGFAPL